MSHSVLEHQVALLFSQKITQPYVSYERALWYAKQMLPYCRSITGGGDNAEEIVERLLEFDFPSELMDD